MTRPSRLRVQGLLLCATATFFSACQEPGPNQLREWRAADHQPPPVVTPEGQGAGEDDGVAPERRASIALWGMRCATCHGSEGRGDGAGRPPGAALPDLTSAAFHSAHSDIQIAAAIAQGKGLMPSFKAELTEQGIAVLVGYVRSLGAAATTKSAQTP